MSLIIHIRRSWTEREIVYLRRNIDRLTNAAISLKLNRSDQSVRSKLHKLHLIRDDEHDRQHR